LLSCASVLPTCQTITWWFLLVGGCTSVSCDCCSHQLLQDSRAGTTQHSA
jgi:hypothetical protein